MGMENLAAAMLVYLMKNVDQNAEWARLKKHGCGSVDAWKCCCGCMGASI